MGHNRRHPQDTPQVRLQHSLDELRCQIGSLRSDISIVRQMVETLAKGLNIPQELIDRVNELTAHAQTNAEHLQGVVDANQPDPPESDE